MISQFLRTRHHLLYRLLVNFLRRLICRKGPIPLRKKQFKGFGKVWIHYCACGLVFSGGYFHHPNWARFIH